MGVNQQGQQVTIKKYPNQVPAFDALTEVEIRQELQDNSITHLISIRQNAVYSDGDQKQHYQHYCYAIILEGSRASCLTL